MRRGLSGLVLIAATALLQGMDLNPVSSSIVTTSFPALSDEQIDYINSLDTVSWKVSFGF